MKKNEQDELCSPYQGITVLLEEKDDIWNSPQRHAVQLEILVETLARFFTRKKERGEEPLWEGIRKLMHSAVHVRNHIDIHFELV
jgi:hypothetical protein